MDVASDAISEALREECAQEFGAGIGVSPWRLEQLAADYVAAANAIAAPTNTLTGSEAWTFADRLASAFDVTVIERARGAPGQYGGAIARRRLCWIVAGLPGALREVLKAHEVLHVVASREAASEGAIWWLTAATLYPASLVAVPPKIADLYLSGAFRFPSWLAERRWSCLEILAAAHDEAV